MAAREYKTLMDASSEQEARIREDLETMQRELRSCRTRPTMNVASQISPNRRRNSRSCSKSIAANKLATTASTSYVSESTALARAPIQ
jgi:hypothetical protein